MSWEGKMNSWMPWLAMVAPLVAILLIALIASKIKKD